MGNLLGYNVRGFMLLEREREREEEREREGGRERKREGERERGREKRERGDIFMHLLSKVRSPREWCK